MQIHKKAAEVHYYSRNGLDHGEQSGYTIFNAVLENQIRTQDYILDCELVAWNKKGWAAHVHSPLSYSQLPLALALLRSEN